MNKQTANANVIFIGKVAVSVVAVLLWELISRDPQLAFFFGSPRQVIQVLWQWFSEGEGTLVVSLAYGTDMTLHFPAQIYPHLIITLTETLLAFVFGTMLGLIVGLLLGISPLITAIMSPYIKALNALPRIILAPIFAMWFGLGIWSKVAFAISLVFFVVFFNVTQGIRHVNPALLANARILGADRRQLLWSVYFPSALCWVFSGLRIAVGLAFVGAVVGEYLGSSQGLGYLILQAEGNFDINTIIAGTLLLTTFALLLDYGVNLIERQMLKYRA